LLPREHRLTSGEDFRQATRKGRRAGSRTLVVHLYMGDGAAGPARAGFVVSKAVGNAVIRNRVKRRLRHLAREHLQTLPGSAVLVVRALPAAGEASYDDLRADLVGALAKATA
jgi:ribonuclease P protein component